jgi:hypothetical protein
VKNVFLCVTIGLASLLIKASHDLLILGCEYHPVMNVLLCVTIRQAWLPIQASHGLLIGGG